MSLLPPDYLFRLWNEKQESIVECLNNFSLSYNDEITRSSVTRGLESLFEGSAISCICDETNNSLSIIEEKKIVINLSSERTLEKIKITMGPGKNPFKPIFDVDYFFTPSLPAERVNVVKKVAKE